MIDDAIFEGGFFYLDLPIYDSGTPALIEAESSYYPLRLALPERISIS